MNSEKTLHENTQAISPMKNNATETNSKLYSLIGEATDTHRPIFIAGRVTGKSASILDAL